MFLYELDQSINYLLSTQWELYFDMVSIESKFKLRPFIEDHLY